MSHPVVLVFVFGLITALATGLGALPFAFLREVSAKAGAYAGAIAAGLILGASFGLIVEGSNYGAWQTLVGAGLGVFFIFFSERVLAGHPHAGLAHPQGREARQIALVLTTMTVHSFAEGVAVGVAFGGGQTLAVMITVAIAVHNIPEGLAISAVMRPRGSSVAACAGWSVFSSLPQPLMAVPAFLFVEAFRPVLPFGLGFAAGAMAFIVFLELLPEAYRNAGKSAVGLLVSVTLGAMILFQQYLG